MKKYLVYIIPGIMIIAILLLFFTGNNKKDRTADQRVTLKWQDKIPYGTYIAFKSLKNIFPKAAVFTDRSEPGYWDTLSAGDSKQALIIVTGQFNADETEMDKLLSFIKNGNSVFVSARTLSWRATEVIKCLVNTSGIPGVEDVVPGDSLHVFLNNPPFTKSKGYYYSGKILDAAFRSVDENTTEVLGEDENGKPDFIHLRAGQGHLFVHLAPLTFTNHFLLYGENMHYYEQVMSVIPADVTRVVWDEYYLNKKFLEKEGEKKNWFKVLSQYPALKAALLTALLSLLVYALMEIRRKQRFIPMYTKPRNDSLDFIKTIGRLYFDKGDNLNLSRKMSAYFLEYVRNKYQLQTNLLDDQFITNLKLKSGADESDVNNIVTFINHLEQTDRISDKQLAIFHRQLDNFYKITR
jgi:hypothetical protein